jgi:hypothetical protein
MNADGTLTAQGEKRNQMTAEERAFDRAGESVHTHEYNPETNRLEKN